MYGATSKVDFFQGGGEIVEQRQVVGTGRAKKLQTTGPKVLGWGFGNKESTFVASPEFSCLRLTLSEG